MRSGGLRVAGRERDPGGYLAVERDLEGVGARPGQGHVEDQHGSGLDVHHARRRLTELDRALAAEQLGATVVHEPDPDGVDADLGPAATHPKHQVGARADRREIAQPDMLKDAEDAQLALLVDQGVVGDDGKIEVQVTPPGSR